MPKKIVEVLKLPEATNSYTGHCMRRTSATLLIDKGGSISDLKRLGEWSSTTSAEGYIEDSIQNKIQTSKKIFSDLTQNEVIVDQHTFQDPLQYPIQNPLQHLPVFIKFKFQHI